MSTLSAKIVGEFNDPLLVQTEDGRTFLVKGLHLMGMDLTGVNDYNEDTRLTVTLNFDQFYQVEELQANCTVDHGKYTCSLKDKHEGKCNLRAEESDDGQG